MIDKKKFLYFNRITFAIIGILLIMLITKVAFSRFFTDSSGVAVGDVAFYIIKPDTQTQTLNMFDIKPDDQDYVYNIDVSNYENDQVSEVDLEYNLSLKTTTNIPVEYKIYLNNQDTNEFNQQEVIQDEDGMYFNQFLTPSQKFNKNQKQTNHYKLIVNFPSKYNEEGYQDLIDSVEITIAAKQV